MKLGLIGKPLGQSKSPEIHKFLLGEEYFRREIEASELDAFFEAKDFDGLNITIPYKTAVIKYLDEISPQAERVGAVNCIANRGGRLCGYNTDIFGLVKTIERLGLDLTSGKTAILGSGGASRAAEEAVRMLGGEPVLVSRTPEKVTDRNCETISYNDLYARSDEFTNLINTTPIGMIPNIDEIPVKLENLPKLQGLIDAVSKPLRTRLVFEAQQLGIKATGGTSMLVAQAHAADEIWTGRTLAPELIEACEKKLRKSMENVVLIGMPGSGKSTSGKIAAEKLGKDFVDMDALIEERAGKSIEEIFASEGEDAFRKLETRLAEELALAEGKVISCGGGIVKRKKNMRLLAHNGIIIRLDRPLEDIQVEPGRPLARNKEDLERLYEERLPLYEAYSDYKVCAKGEPKDVADDIITLLENRYGE